MLVTLKSIMFVFVTSPIVTCKQENFVQQTLHFSNIAAQAIPTTSRLSVQQRANRRHFDNCRLETRYRDLELKSFA